MGASVLCVAVLHFSSLQFVASAQPTPPAPPSTSTTEPTPEAPLPHVPPQTALSGKALLDAMRAGGLVFYMRHALQIPPTDEDCTKPNLAAEGIEQTARVGRAIRALKIPIGRVLSSYPCRNQETARRLALGAMELTTDLNPIGLPAGANPTAARMKRLSELPAKGTNTLLISHVHGSKNKAEWMHLEIAEIIVYRPDGKPVLSPPAPVARIRVEAWEALMTLDETKP